MDACFDVNLVFFWIILSIILQLSCFVAIVKLKKNFVLGVVLCALIVVVLIVCAGLVTNYKLVNNTNFNLAIKAENLRNDLVSLCNIDLNKLQKKALDSYVCSIWVSLHDKKLIGSVDYEDANCKALNLDLNHSFV